MAPQAQAQAQHILSTNNNDFLNPNAQEFHPNLHPLNHNYHNYTSNHFPSSFHNHPSPSNPTHNHFHNNFQNCPSNFPSDHHHFYYYHRYSNYNFNLTNITQNYHNTPPPPQLPSPRADPARPGPNINHPRRRREPERKSGLSTGDDGNKGVDNNNNNQGQNGKFKRGKCRVIREYGGERKKGVVKPVKIDGFETTAMIKNIPNQYTRRMLIKFLDEFCNVENQKLVINDNAADSGPGRVDHPSLAYDFVYLPIDFATLANKGYGFVNFNHPLAVWKLHQAFSNKGWKHCCSSKRCQIACAAIQGKEKLIEHFGKSRFMCYNDEYLPVCFNPPRDGSSASVDHTIIGERIPLLST